MEEQLTERFFGECRRYLSGEKSMTECADALDISVNTFRHRMYKAYKDGFLVLKGKLNRRMGDDLARRWFQEGLGLIEVFVAEGSPDDAMFARTAAEMLLGLIREPLEDVDRREVNIGIVSGSSTGQMVAQLVQGPVWNELMSGAKVPPKKEINVVALNVTPVAGWELEGNANIAVLRLAVLLRDRLPKCRVMPCGLGSTLVVGEEQLHHIDSSPSNKTVVDLADPGRLTGSKGSRLDLVITGVGSPENSVFSQVLADEGIVPPEEMVGDVAFSPVDKDGKELTLMRKRRRLRQSRKSKSAGTGSERCLIYSAIRLETMRGLVESGARVALIARNRRRGTPVGKKDAILAAIRGRYANVVITDAVTSTALLA